MLTLYQLEELIGDPEVRGEVLREMSLEPKNSVVAFVGPFDAMMRGGANRMEELMADIKALRDEAVELGTRRKLILIPPTNKNKYN